MKLAKQMSSYQVYLANPVRPISHVRRLVNNGAVSTVPCIWEVKEALYQVTSAGSSIRGEGHQDIKKKRQINLSGTMTHEQHPATSTRELLGPQTHSYYYGRCYYLYHVLEAHLSSHVLLMKGLWRDGKKEAGNTSQADKPVNSTSIPLPAPACRHLEKRLQEEVVG